MTLENPFWVKKEKFKSWVERYEATSIEDGYRINQTLIRIVEEDGDKILIEANGIVSPVPGDTFDIARSLKSECE